MVMKSEFLWSKCFLNAHCGTSLSLKSTGSKSNDIYNNTCCNNHDAVKLFMLSSTLTCFLEQLPLDDHLDDVIYCNRKLWVKQAGLGPQANLLPEQDHRKQNAKCEGSRGGTIEWHLYWLSLSIYTNGQRNNDRRTTPVSHQSKGNTSSCSSLGHEDGQAMVHMCHSVELPTSHV